MDIGTDILRQLDLGLDDTAILAIIDGHDTTKAARSPKMPIVKDADKLWRFTPHGVATIGGRFTTEAPGTPDHARGFRAALVPDIRSQDHG